MVKPKSYILKSKKCSSKLTFLSYFFCDVTAKRAGKMLVLILTDNNTNNDKDNDKL